MPRPRSSGPTVLQMVLGRRLQELRDRAGLTAKNAGDLISRNATSVTRMEKAEGSLDPLKVAPLLAAYGVPRPAAQEFLALLQEANRPGWWQKFTDVIPPGFAMHVSLETSATQIRSYEPNVVPGLLQTRRYCEAVLREGFPKAAQPEIDRRVDLRMERQQLLDRTDAPLLWMVMDHCVLARPAAGPDIMREQIDHLRQQATRPNVSLQIIPFAAGYYHGAFGPFSIFRFPVADFPDIVAIESIEGTAHRDNEDIVAAYRAAFENMFSFALPLGQTGAFLDNIAKELYP